MSTITTTTTSNLDNSYYYANDTYPATYYFYQVSEQGGYYVASKKQIKTVSTLVKKMRENGLKLSPKYTSFKPVSPYARDNFKFPAGELITSHVEVLFLD